MAERLHPVFGTTRRLSRDNRCSICGVDAGEVPLMIFAHAGPDAWVYCDEHAEPIVQIALPRAKVAM